MTYEIQHNTVLTQVFKDESEYNREKKAIETYKGEFENIVDAIMHTDGIRGGVYAHFGTFVPESQYIVFNALRKEDFPHGIFENSIYIKFRVDMAEKTVEAYTWGHIYLTEHDQKTSYNAACTMKQMHTANGGKWMRKSKYKSAADLVKKMKTFWAAVCDSLDVMTEGYPYKRMTKDIY